MFLQTEAPLSSRASTAVQGRHRPMSSGRQTRTGDGGTVPKGDDADRELMEGLRHGEPSAAEQLVTRYGDRAHRLAIRITGSEQDAEEVVQDALWAVIRRIDTFRGDAAFGSWVYRIVANGAYQKLRRRRGRAVALDDVLPFFDERGRHVGPMADWSGRDAEESVQTEFRIILTSAIEELPDAFRVVLMLRGVEGRSYREVAGALSLTVATVKSRVHRARLLLRKRLGGGILGAER